MMLLNATIPAGLGLFCLFSRLNITSSEGETISRAANFQWLVQLIPWISLAFPGSHAGDLLTLHFLTPPLRLLARLQQKLKDMLSAGPCHPDLR